MKKFLTAAVLVMLAAFVVCAVTPTDASAKEWKKIRIGTEGAYPPFNFIDSDGNVQGFDIDIAKAVCAAMNVECEFVIQDWEGLIPGLLAKKFDIIAASMSKTEERMKRVDFSDKYYVTPARFVAKKGSGFTVSKEGLKGKSIGVQRATITDNFVQDNFGSVADVKAYGTLEEALMDLTAGRVDLVCADSLVLALGFLKKPEGKDYEFVGPGFTDQKWFGEGIAFALRKGEPELKKLLNDGIKKIREDGAYQKVNAQYFEFDVFGE